MKTIDDFVAALREFVDISERIIGKVNLKIYDPIKASEFNLHYKKIDPGNGIYVFFDHSDNRVVYVGISNNIFKRFLDHIGTGYKFEQENSFPNFTLVEKYHWAREETKNLLRSGNFMVQVIDVDPPDSSRLLEAFLIYYGSHNNSRPELNASF